ncbi:MAG TPA: glycosyltransferase [Hellea balneolensis]|uniref:Glycosyltransferase n=1 Tax=Hellea balneolensis TaxID=287478 RepID=A0A7C5R7Q5_9PROT|nr:glycosyltransferase [Hellea balneolensis]
MNILQIVPELNAGGVEGTVVEIAEALAQNGHVAHVASAGGRLESALAKLGAVHHTLPLASKNPLSIRPNTKALIGIIRKFDIDIVHARSRAPAWAAKAAADGTKTPFITTYHGIYNAKSGLKRRYNRIMAKGDLVIANSEFTKAHIIREHGLPADRIIVIPRGVDPQVFNPALFSADDMAVQRQNWGVPNTRPLLLHPGRLTRWKGQLVSLGALDMLHKAGIDAHLVILGDAQGRDKYVEELKSKTKAADLTNRVTFAPHTSNMPIAYAASDIVLVPSTEPEAFGRTAIEAGAMEKPVIASDHGGTKETIIHGETGALFPPGNAGALAQSIQKMLSLEPAKRAQITSQARAHIREKYSTASLQKATLAVYRRIIAQK